MRHNHDFVLITGMARSGTTVLGEQLCRAPNVRELYEPMNLTVGDRSIANWYELPGSEDFPDSKINDLLERIKAGKIRLKTPIISGGDRRNPFLNRTRISALKLAFARRAGHVVWKDPFAFFLAPTVASKWGIPSIVTIRDPLSVVGSHKRMSWSPDASGLVTRMLRAGRPVPPSVAEFALQASSAADRTAAVWHLLYSECLRWLKEGEAVIPVINSDLFNRPDEITRRLRGVLPFAFEVEPPAMANVDEKPLPEKAHVKLRSAASVTDYWRKVLNAEEVAACNALNERLWEELEAEAVAFPAAG